MWQTPIDPMAPLPLRPLESEKCQSVGSDGCPEPGAPGAAHVGKPLGNFAGALAKASDKSEFVFSPARNGRQMGSGRFAPTDSFGVPFVHFRKSCPGLFFHPRETPMPPPLCQGRTDGGGQGCLPAFNNENQGCLRRTHNGNQGSVLERQTGQTRIWPLEKPLGNFAGALAQASDKSEFPSPTPFVVSSLHHFARPPSLPSQPSASQPPRLRAIFFSTPK